MGAAGAGMQTYESELKDVENQHLTPSKLKIDDQNLVSKAFFVVGVVMVWKGLNFDG